MSVKINNPKFYEKNESGFFEVYGAWGGHGWGTMLVYYAPRNCTYVQFTPEGSMVKKVLSRELLDAYKKGINEDNAKSGTFQEESQVQGSSKRSKES